jgi:hypothetical protein
MSAGPESKSRIAYCTVARLHKIAAHFRGRAAPVFTVVRPAEEEPGVSQRPCYRYAADLPCGPTRAAQGDRHKPKVPAGSSRRGAARPA